MQNHGIAKSFSKDGKYHVLCECGKGFKHELPSTATWGWEDHSTREFDKVTKDVEPILLATHKKARITHKYWLYTSAAMKELRWAGNRPTWFEKQFVLYRWAKYGVVREQQNGLRLLQIFPTEENARIWVYQQVIEFKRMGEKAVMLESIDIPEGVTAPAKTLEDYIASLIDQCKTNDPKKIKSLTQEIEKAEGYMPLLVEAKNQMVRRLFT